MKKKTVALLMALVLIFGVAAGGTVAWLTDKTETITNTFIDSDINIKLTETKGGTDKTFKMVPGGTIDKDPIVTVEANSEACWLFVKLEKSENYDNYLTHTMAADTDNPSTWAWTLVNETAYPGVYYIKVDASTATAGKEYKVLANNQLTVKGDVTKAMMDAIDGIVVTTNADGTTTTTTNDATELAKRPTLTVTAYAIQQANLDYGEATGDTAKAAIAWELANS